MGVTGLWKLIDASGKPVPLETLENKVLAIDISIWLHQVVKGFQDAKGGSIPNAHLLGLFHRLCKLLFYRIKPVFVFDGGCPSLKRETIAKRSQAKNKHQQEADRLQQLLLENLAKEKVVQQALGVNAALLISPKKLITPEQTSKDDLFKLPPIFQEEKHVEAVAGTSADSSMEESDEPSTKTHHNFNLHTIDVKSAYFLNLPADIRHDILTDLKETRKQSSWGRLHELPAESNTFSSFQMKRLLKRRQVQVSLEEAEQEMGGKCLSMAELENLLNEEGFETEAANVGKHIASDENTRYLLVKDIKALMETGKMSDAPSPAKKLKTLEVKAEGSVLGQEFDLELQQAIEMSLTVNEKDADGRLLAMDEVKMSYEQKKSLASSELSCARDYMLEFGGMSSDNIKELLTTETKKDGDEEEDLEATQFYFNDKYIVKGYAQTPERTKAAKTDTAVAEIIDISSPVSAQKVVLSQKTNESVDVSSGSDSDSDFIDVPDDELSEVDGLPKLAVLPIRKNYLVDGTPSKDFRLEDLNIKFTQSTVEIVIQPSAAPLEDDLFADIFATTTTKESSSEVVNIDTDDVKDNSVVPQIEKTPEKQELLPTEQTVGEIIELSDGEDVVKEKKQSALDQFLKSYTPTKATKTPPKEIDVPKVASPFFVKRTPTSSSKKASSADSSEKAKSKLISKSLFGDGKADDNSMAGIEKIFNADAVYESEAEKLKADNTTDELRSIAQQLRDEGADLMAEKNKQNRMGVSITEQMSKDCMQLLRLFGIPYVVAPMEAESQCAFLNTINLTDGTITDDSDIWLFGGKKVYKNFFNQKKLVMEYEVDNIERLFQMDRKKMIQLAMLVGSDYTTGINGIGAVTALEILASFPTTPESEGETSESMSILSGLRKFREWLLNGKTTTTCGRTALKSKLKNIEIIEGFPNYTIAEAYLRPVVDNDAAEFSWGVPDAESLYEFAKQTFGWTRSRTDDILLPVLKKLNEKKNQQSIMNYFQVQSTVSNTELTVSKRVKKAIDIMSGKVDINAEEKPKEKVKRKPRAKKEKAIDAQDESKEAEASTSQGSPKAKATRKPRAKKEKTTDPQVEGEKAVAKAKRKPRAKKEVTEEPVPCTSDPVSTTGDTEVDPVIFDDPVEIADDEDDYFQTKPKPVPRKRKNAAEPERKPQIIGGISRIMAGINARSAVSVGAAPLPKRANRTPRIPDPSPKIPQKESDLRAITENRMKAIEKFKNTKNNQ